MVRISFLISFFILFSFSGLSKDTTNVKKDKWENYEHKPKRSALWSLFPGAGQIYNEVGYRKVQNKRHRAWWKVPIIYGGLGACGYYFYDNYKRARMLKEEVLFRRDNGDSTNLHPELLGYITENALINGYNDGNENQYGFNFRAKRRDLFMAATIGIYALNIIEAFVDGHFVSFDVSEDLSLTCTPIMFDQYTPGVSLRLSIF